MVFSASAVTADSQYGNGYIFLARQLVWLVAGLFGMFALMRTRLPQAARTAVIFTTICVVLLMLVGVFFLDKSHATHRWIRLGPANLAAFRARQARGDSVSGMVSGVKAAQRVEHGI